MKIFDSDILKLHAKAIVCKSRVEHELPILKLATEESTHDYIFSSTPRRDLREDQIDGDLEMADPADVPLTSTTCPMNQGTCEDTRKRKDGRMAEREIPKKFLKFHLHENAARCRFFQTDKRIEVDNPVYYGDALEMEH